MKLGGFGVLFSVELISNLVQTKQLEMNNHILIGSSYYVGWIKDMYAQMQYFPLSLYIQQNLCLKQYCWDPAGVGIELDRVIHWAILTLGPGADIKLQSLLNQTILFQTSSTILHMDLSNTSQTNINPYSDIN